MTESPYPVKRYSRQELAGLYKMFGKNVDPVVASLKPWQEVCAFLHLEPGKSNF